MSGILAQLVGRATGAVAPGLRPRLPSRFELGLPAAGFSDEATDIPASPVVLPDRDEAPAPLRRLAAARAAADQPTPIAVAPKIAPAAAEQPFARSASAGVPEGKPDRPPASLLPPHSAPLVRNALEGAAPPAPPPLLPAVAFGRVQATIFERLTGDQPRPAGPAVPAGTEHAPEPEITIHIGRLDIRSDAPAPAPPRLPAARSLPSLSDYLRGGRT